MMTSIQLSEETKQKLIEIMSRLQSSSHKRMTYEDIILHLIQNEKGNFQKRLNFAEKYSGILKDKDVYSHLEEIRKLER